LAGVDLPYIEENDLYQQFIERAVGQRAKQKKLLDKMPAFTKAPIAVQLLGKRII